MIEQILKGVLGIVGLSVVVLIHEGGHFIAALLTKIRVKAFSVGFGPRIAGFTKGETEYRLSLIPLGGYCRFYGEDSFQQAMQKKMEEVPYGEGEFYSSAPWKRVLVAFSGPLANILFAILLYTAIYGIGYTERYTEPRILLASEYRGDGSSWPADEAGLRSGDLIRAVDGTPISRFSELQELVIFKPSKTINLQIFRDGKTFDVPIVPMLDKSTGRAIIGVLNWIDPVVEKVERESDGEKAGLIQGDRIVSFDGTAVSNFSSFYRLVDAASANATKKGTPFVVERNNRKISLVWPKNSNGNVGILPLAKTGRSEPMNPAQALGQGFKEVGTILFAIVHGIRLMFSGIDIGNAVAGPIRLIADTGTVLFQGFQEGPQRGLLWSAELLCFISVSLAFLNLLPIPVLDGGQILLFIIEIIRRKAIKPVSVHRYQIVGVIIVIAIALSVTMSDVLHFSAR